MAPRVFCVCPPAPRTPEAHPSPLQGSTTFRGGPLSLMGLAALPLGGQESQEQATTSQPVGPPPETKPASPFGSMLVPMALVFGIFYFVMIGPERKQRRRREEMLKSLKKGDRVVTTGGMHATVAALQEDVVTLQIADGVRVRYSLAAVQTVLESTSGEEKKG